MAFTVREIIRKEGKTRRFSAIPGMMNADYWEFKYITKNTDFQDQTIYGGIVYDKKTDPPYPKPYNNVIGTIFFSSEPEILYLSNEISNIIIDTEPPKFISENVQYVTFHENRVCKFTFESDTLIDVCQLVIRIGDKILCNCKRKGPEYFISDDILNITLNKVKNQYILSFTLPKYSTDIETGIESGISVDVLNQNQLTVEIWDIAANHLEYTTHNKWQDLNGNIDDLKPLIIEFIETIPPDLLISKNVEGKVLVKITNPNESLKEIKPTIDLFDNSIGYFDPNAVEGVKDMKTGRYTGVWKFYITNINQKGMVNVEAWIDIDNNDIKEYVKNRTYASASLGPFIYEDEGRKYKFNGYTPVYLNDDLYKSFVKYVETFLNTSQESLSTGNRISTLEKIARINNFMDPFMTEPPYLSEYSKEFNIEVNPNLNEYIYYLNHQKD